ncbi:uncharacterized protein LOC110685176 [Chenopodium quinoa]|nr:uncharacterized protein LOC110685176 [Chenopodium quinoa]
MQPSATMRSGSSSLYAFIPLLTNDFVEISHVKISDEVMEEFLVPTGTADEPWHPRIQVNRGESVIIVAGSMGWRMLKDLATPADRPIDRLYAPCSQLMNDMLRTVNWAVEVVHMYKYFQKYADKAAEKVKKADEERKAAVLQVEDYKVKMKLLEKQVTDQEELKKKLVDQNKLKTKIANLEKSLKVEKVDKEKLMKSLEEARLEKPGIRRKAVNRFMRSDLYQDKLVDRYTGGWVVAHRCVCKVEDWEEKRWQAVEDAYDKDKHHSPTTTRRHTSLTLPPLR